MADRDDFIDSILSHGPSAGSLHVVLKKMKRDGRLTDVIQTCNRFIGFFPDDIGLRVLLAESYAEAGFISLAAAQLETAAAMIDKLASAYRRLAEIYTAAQRYTEAADMLRRYLAHRPDEPDALALLGRVEMAAREEDKPAGMEPLPEDTLLPEDSEDHTDDLLIDFATPTIAELYYEQGRVDAAIDTYETVVRHHPDDATSLNRLAELKAIVNAAASEKQETGDLRTQKEWLVSTLERWLPKLKEMKHG